MSDGTVSPPKQKLPIEEVLDKHNLKIDNFVVALKEGLTAEDIRIDRYGDEVARVPDHATRHKFFASGMELLGYLKSVGTTVTVSQITATEREILEMYGKYNSVRAPKADTPTVGTAVVGSSVEPDTHGALPDSVVS